jgi:hypothetical protein
MNEWALAAYLTLFASDAVSGHQADAFCATRACTVHEQFLTQSATANDAIVAGQATALWWATNKIKRPWLKWSLRFGVASVHGVAAAHNWQQIQKAQGR